MRYSTVAYWPRAPGESTGRRAKRRKRVLGFSGAWEPTARHAGTDPSRGVGDSRAAELQPAGRRAGVPRQGAADIAGSVPYLESPDRVIGDKTDTRDNYDTGQCSTGGCYSVTAGATQFASSEQWARSGGLCCCGTAASKTRHWPDLPPCPPSRLVSPARNAGTVRAIKRITVPRLTLALPSILTCLGAPACSKHWRRKPRRYSLSAYTGAARGTSREAALPPASRIAFADPSA